MTEILLVTKDSDRFKKFNSGLNKGGDVKLTTVDSAAKALERAKECSFTLVIVDQILADMDSLALVRKLLEVNALINTAVVTDMSHDEFHEAAEGLGVLKGISPSLEEAEGVALMEKLSSLPSF